MGRHTMTLELPRVRPAADEHRDWCTRCWVDADVDAPNVLHTHSAQLLDERDGDIQVTAYLHVTVSPAGDVVETQAGVYVGPLDRAGDILDAELAVRMGMALARAADIVEREVPA
ncbi:hypothetical protein [Pseudonocardia dioxanivorans]|jgi:hypothetical protein|uniref:hypothetical protein n=1 Tax=Pseudonocardia dioxanivorans TaxID=240495 RepID=UPI000CD231DC|nr:hypothetical protein [Pseudonocardia dioxanivorans]